MKRITYKSIWQEWANTYVADHPVAWSSSKDENGKAGFDRNQTILMTLNRKPVITHNYRDYAKVVLMFFELTKTSVIQGDNINLSTKLGSISARHIEGNPAKLVPDWVKTREGWRTGKLLPNRLIYTQQTDYLRIGWNKHRRYSSSKFYELILACSSTSSRLKGIRVEFRKANELDPSLRYKYQFFPLVRSKRIQGKLETLKQKESKQEVVVDFKFDLQKELDNFTDLLF